MADIPTPRSYSQILGEMVDALLSRLGLPSLRVGSPALSILEAAAQSDLRSSQDIFNLLNSLSLDRASGLALDRIGADEQVPRLGQTAASGAVDISDTAFTKISTLIYQGLGSPIVGTMTLNVDDASLFPTSGNIYVGRGTTNYEGPIPYTATTNVGSYWALTLGTGTTKFHNLGEGVVLAQGGNRNIPAGTLMATPQGNAGTAVQFSTLYGATIPDGETLVQNIPSVARVPGSIGNVIANSVTTFVSPPFTTAAVNNPAPFANGLDTEDDQSYRERIRSARNSRSKGTDLAIQTGVIGITALDENKRVLSASIVTREDEPVTLYIDDGTGYEPISEGIAFEIIVDDALGGEQYLQLANGRPVQKASIVSALSAPFVLSDNCQLAVEVSGVRSTHQFPASDFSEITNASAFEVAASINSDPAISWSASATNNGNNVLIFAKADSNEDLQVVAADAGLIDANDLLGFNTNPAKTLWLYKNDVLLEKDGELALLTTKPQSQWSSIATGATLNISVDGIPLTITINDVDFINAGTSYVKVAATNSLASWAQVLNYKIPGVTVTVDGGSLDFTSNSGRSSRAAIAITGGSMQGAMFSTMTAQGRNKDYSLDRNLGQIKLETPLIAEDRLTAGSLNTRGFVVTPAFTTHNIASVATSVAGQNGAELWVVVDGNAQIVNIGAGIGTSLTVTNPTSPTWGKRVRYNSNAAANLFGNALEGDWVIATDLAFNIANRGAYRIAAVDAGGTWIEVERPSSWSTTQAAFNLLTGGMKVVRTLVEPQRVFITTANNYTALSLVTAMQPQLDGATAEVYQTQQVLLRTNSFTGGDIAVVAANDEGVLLGFPLTGAVASGISHLASIVASHPQTGTPGFNNYTVFSVTSSTVINYGSGTAPSSSGILVGLKALDDTSGTKYSNKNHISGIASQSGTVLTLRTPALEQWLPQDRFYVSSSYGITARDQIAVVVDGDEISKRYVMNMYRRVTPGSTTYGSTNDFHDADNGGVSLAEAFGTNFDWSDFAVHMKARGKANGIMWRYYRHGPEGNYARVQYTYPTVASQATSVVTVNTRLDDYVDIGISLRSGAARTGVGIHNTSAIGAIATSGPDVNNLYTYLYVMYLAVSSGQRVIQLNYTGGNANVFSGVVTGGTSGATATVVSDTPGGTGTGVLILTGPVGSFVNGETITAGSASATTNGTMYGLTTLTLTLPSPATDHGWAVGNIIWFQSTNVNFSSGPYTITARTASSISFVDVATTQGATATPGRVSQDTLGEVTLNGSTVVVGDIFTMTPSLSMIVGAPPVFQTIKTLTLGSDSFTGQSPNAGTPTTTLSWYYIGNTANVSWYPLDSSNTLTNINTDVSGSANTPISGYIYGTPSSTILAASYEAPGNGGIGNTYPWYNLVDGINYVLSNTMPGSPSTQVNFTFKNATDGSLSTNSDWIDEDVRLVPTTVANIVNYLNSAAIGGLFEATEIAIAQDGQKPQITTITVGSQGDINVSGGNANNVAVPIVGSAVVAADTSVVSVLASEADGLRGNAWVRLENAVVAPKAIITSATALTSIDATGAIVVTGTKLWKWSADGGSTEDIASANWQIERQGNYMAYVWTGASPYTNFANVAEGDWVYLTNFTGTMNTLNTGVFRVVRTNGVDTFWIENPNGVEEISSAVTMFFDYNSAIYNDTLIINTPLWGSANVGTWTVLAPDLTNQYRILVKSLTGQVPVAAGPVAALGINAGLIQVYESSPSRLTKQISGIAPNGSSLVDIKFTTKGGYQNVGAAYGTIIRALDKLQFGIDQTTGAVQSINPGVDAYVHNAGLIAEANKVVYGDESDSSSYPGIAAAGANINISGPIIRRIQVSFAVRAATGVDTQDIRAKVRSAVASVINQAGVGESIAISKLITAAQGINGVVGITVLAPVYGSGNDLIPIQPFEKALVLDVEQDIQVSLVE